MTLKDMENKLREIGIYGFRDFESQVCKDPIHLEIVFELDFEYELFADNCNEFWDFFITATGRKDIDNLIFEIPQNTKLYFEYKDTVLEAFGYENIEYTTFYQLLYQALSKFLDNLWEELCLEQ